MNKNRQTIWTNEKKKKCNKNKSPSRSLAYQNIYTMEISLTSWIMPIEISIRSTWVAPKSVSYCFLILISFKPIDIFFDAHSKSARLTHFHIITEQWAGNNKWQNELNEESKHAFQCLKSTFWNDSETKSNRFYLNCS